MIPYPILKKDIQRYFALIKGLLLIYQLLIMLMSKLIEFTFVVMKTYFAQYRCERSNALKKFGDKRNYKLATNTSEKLTLNSFLSEFVN